jgi:hypothetical protein
MRDKQFELMKAIRDGLPYSKRDAPLAALSRAALADVVRDPVTHSAKSVTLTAWGRIVLENEERKRNAGTDC